MPNKLSPYLIKLNICLGAQNGLSDNTYTTWAYQIMSY